ncbi:tubulin-tyrosine ligase family-domain-containing protein [Multifurca ochricompacta]|uniref:Tubulin-tyrosine ligase family-domain-containing protein n=1 Tax=Multifurca ochricompacta TaxID=376703 RepID=A0AAD4MDG7_9AGAM|nr:tubulin-tyrosine ligase family-domain-containing protein [Multifurca ochricompacta]
MVSDSIAFVSWQSAPFTDTLVRNALLSLPAINLASIYSTLPQQFNKLIQWSSYDEIDHTLIHSDHPHVLSSSYVIRKALIRKHFLSRCIHSFLVKHPHSVLRTAVPQTWEIEISFADELDDLWADELWDLSNILDKSMSIPSPETDHQWWILKPGMADRGMGIRLFNSKEGLRQLLEGFDDDDDDDSPDGDEDGAADESENNTSIAISQLRHFVIQEYLSKPLLLDPREVSLGDAPPQLIDQLQGHKFHLRAYCVASGDLTVYLYTRILALFSSKPYSPPAAAADGVIDLLPHLTNSSLHTHKGEECVRLLDELVGCHVLSGEASASESTLTLSHLADIQDQIANSLAETFTAALQWPIYFQPMPNAFELYGVDFLVEHVVSFKSQFQVKLLEINAEPAIELTGSRLAWILEDLFKAMARVFVDPFVQDTPVEAWPVGQTRHFLKNCLQAEVRGSLHDSGKKIKAT